MVRLLVLMVGMLAAKSGAGCDAVDFRVGLSASSSAVCSSALAGSRESTSAVVAPSIAAASGMGSDRGSDSVTEDGKRATAVRGGTGG